MPDVPSSINRARTHKFTMQLQTQLIAKHVAELQKLLLIDDIYEHPLMGRNDIVVGHCLRAFAGMSISGGQGGFQGILCTVDTKKRRWNDEDTAVLRRTACQGPARFEDLRYAM